MKSVRSLRRILRERVTSLHQPDLNEFGHDPFGFEPLFLPDAACYLAFIQKLLSSHESWVGERP